jgi:carboxymethylenebutenolidase
MVMFKHAGKETFDGFLARPKASGAFPAVLVITGRSIAEEYIQNTCAALALAGFVGLAPNIFHPLPHDTTDSEERTKYLKDHTIDDALEDIQVGEDYLRTQPFVRAGGFGILGFCYGGWLALQTAARSREIRAVVAYHPGIGRHREDISQVQLHQGTADHSVDPKSAMQLRDTLAAQHVPVELFMYEGADHGFTAYTREFYRPDDAKLSWSRTIKFLSKRLNEK